MGVNGQSVSVNGNNAIGIGTTTIGSGTSGRVLYDNAGSVGEKVVTGSGLSVLQTSPTLITPILGVAAATSVNFGGSTLSTYIEGTWVPVDMSGATLTFSSVVGTYIRIGKLVVARFTLTFPVTVSGSAVAIGGLPVASQTSAAAIGSGNVLTQAASPNGNVSAYLGSSATAFNLVASGSGVLILNSSLSTSVVSGTILYITD